MTSNDSSADGCRQHLQPCLRRCNVYGILWTSVHDKTNLELLYSPADPGKDEVGKT